MPRLVPGAVALLMLAAMAQAEAASFVLDDGSVIEGRLIASTRNTLTIRAEVGGIRQIPLSQLAGVRALMPSGRTVAGLVREVDGDRIAIAAGPDQVHWIVGDRVVGTAGADRPPAIAAAPSPEASERAAPAAPPPAEDRSGTVRQAATPAAEPEDPDRPAPADVAEEPAESVTVAIPPAAPVPPPVAAGTGQTPPRVEVTTAGGGAAEGDGAVTFKVTLSHPSDRPVRLVYSTVDGQAASGVDYEPEQGVLTLPAGETVREIEARLIDDVVAEEPEQFFLFVTADPADASLAEKWHAVTIEDDD